MQNGPVCWRRQGRFTSWKVDRFFRLPELGRGLAIVAIVIVVAAGEQVGDGLNVGVAGVIEAGKSEAAFDGFEQREVGVTLRAGQAMRAVVGVDHEQYLIDIGREAVVIFIPDEHDGVAAFMPIWRRLDGLYQTLYDDIAAEDKRRIQSGLRAVVAGVEVAEC